MDESGNRLEIIINLLYLARYSGADVDAAQSYIAQAEKQALELAVSLAKMYKRTPVS